MYVFIQVLPIIDLMAATNAHFRKLREFITLQLPAGFPVKIGECYFTSTCLLSADCKEMLFVF